MGDHSLRPGGNAARPSEPTGDKPQEGPTGAHYDVAQVVHARTDRDLRQLPQLLSGALRLVWAAARWQLVFNVCLQAVTSAAMAAELLVAERLLSRLLADNGTRDFLSAVPYIIAFAVILAVTSTVTVVRTELQRLLAELVGRSATEEVVRAAGRADLARFEEPEFHDRAQRAIVNATVRPLQMTLGLLSVASSTLSAAAVGAVLLTIEPLFLALGVVAAVPLTLSSLRVGQVLYQFAVEQTPTDRERTYVQTLLIEKGPAKEVRAYQLAGVLADRFSALYARRISALRRLVRRRTVQGVAGGLLTAVIFSAVLGLLIEFISDGRVSLAGAGAAAGALILLGSQMEGLAAGLGQLYESALFIKDYDDFVKKVPARSQFVGKAAPPVPIGDIRAEGLTFTYPSRQSPSLEGVDLEVMAGEVVALVGENGSGKTTLAKLLASLYKPQSGSVTWSGQDVAGMDVEQLRGRVAVLFQDFVHYYLSARENITMGRWERADNVQAMRLAAGRSGAAEAVEGLVEGYETYLGPQYFGGSDLSGGQWQTIALARAFFRDAELVILDEPTASLDPRAEAALFAAVRELFAGRSVLLITHRFASARLADRIYVLEKGRVIEHGDHSGLMAQGGTYAELFNLQSAAFGLG